MELKGNISIEEQSTEVNTVGERNLPQIQVNKTYRVSGVDLSDGESDTGNEDNDASRADELADAAKTQIIASVESFNQFINDVTDSDNFVGLTCEVTIYNVQTIESLKNCSIDIEIAAIYDVPVSSLEEAIESAKTALLGK